jgi:hypothetical protein
MRFIIIICLLLASFPAAAQSQGRALTPDGPGGFLVFSAPEISERTINTINSFISEEIEKDWAEHVAKLTVLAKEFKALKLKLRQIKLEILITKQGRNTQADQPYPWPSDKCEEVPGSKDANRCLWIFTSPPASHICEVWWINEAEMWYQDSAMQCLKTESWTQEHNLKGVGGTDLMF